MSASDWSSVVSSCLQQLHHSSAGNNYLSPFVLSLLFFFSFFFSFFSNQTSIQLLLSSFQQCVLSSQVRNSIIRQKWRQKKNNNPGFKSSQTVCVGWGLNWLRPPPPLAPAALGGFETRRATRLLPVCLTCAVCPGVLTPRRRGLA